MQGCCPSMCPLDELNERTRLQELSKYELPPNAPVKRYRRSAAGQVVNPSDVRPVQVLLKTTYHLLSLLPSQLEMPIDLYHFLDDRFRAIRTDLVLQNETPMDILQPIARFYLVAQCILLHETQKPSSPVEYASIRRLLEDQLHSILGLVKHSSPEFRRYYLLVHTHQDGFSLVLRDLYLHCEDKQHEWRDLLSWLRASSQTMESHLIHRAIRFGTMTTQLGQHLRVLAKAYTKQDQFPLVDVANFLGILSPTDVSLLCKAFHIAIHEPESPQPFVKFNETPMVADPESALLIQLMNEEYSRIDALRDGKPLQDILLQGVLAP
ncbi:hypothetical protein LEN26_013799 [Aphanomyces euteiches]|nr:hypothetical protein LEN26_013799 [Aphanomyces euteiches]KAH9116521.1 hypothetical protein AeMF1_009557 [Aphanomyces euteiches]KAH9194839.1 hypothetical protein AeNC1_003171 [Aphanomyces euteiches]